MIGSPRVYRTLSTVFAAVAVWGCDGYTGPIGSFSLAEVDGQALPFVVRSDSVQTTTLEVDEIFISPFGVYERRTRRTTLDRASGESHDISTASRGTVTPAGSGAQWQLRQFGCYGDVLALCDAPPILKLRGRGLELRTAEPSSTLVFVQR